MTELKDIDWLEPWYACSSVALAAEAEKEIAPGHPLFGRQMIAVGRRQDCDDVLFFLPDNLSPLAVVHLTWIGKRECNSEYPATVFFSSFSDWVENCMNRDHADFVVSTESPPER